MTAQRNPDLAAAASHSFTATGTQGDQPGRIVRPGLSPTDRDRQTVARFAARLAALERDIPARLLPALRRLAAAGEPGADVALHEHEHYDGWDDFADAVRGVAYAGGDPDMYVVWDYEVRRTRYGWSTEDGREVIGPVTQLDVYGWMAADGVPPATVDRYQAGRRKALERGLPTSLAERTAS